MASFFSSLHTELLIFHTFLFFLNFFQPSHLLLARLFVRATEDCWEHKEISKKRVLISLSSSPASFSVEFPTRNSSFV